jgi:acyl dehydratase
VKVNVGDVIPSWTMTSVSIEKMKTMAAILRDPNPVHWNRKTVAAMGMGERTINQGPLGISYMVNMLQAWAGENCIQHMHVTFPNPLILDEDEIIARGQVKAVDEDGLIYCETWLERNGERGLIEAEVTLNLHNKQV